LESDMNFVRLISSGKERRLTVILVEAKLQRPEKSIESLLNRIVSKTPLSETFKGE
jgi:hypothetical protein